MPNNIENLFVLTGGPGSGKTTILEGLTRAGFARSVEAGRGVIQDQAAIGGQGLPWGNRALFAELMLSWEMRSYRLAQEETGIVFFDRGVPDVIGYLRLVGLPVPAHMEKAAETFRYNRRVFVAPPWPEIFAQDSERRQTLDEAERTYHAMIEAYSDYGYELVEIPRLSAEDRVCFVLEAAGLPARGRASD